MTKTVLTFGGLSGLVVGGTLLLGSVATDKAGFPEWLGYLLMLVALSLIFVGIRQHRDQDRAGSITFLQACKVGMGITLVAGVFYVLAWELSLVMTDYAFIESYAELLRQQAADLPAAERAAREADIELNMTRYQNPLFRMPITLLEILPVGVLVTLVAAGVLRRKDSENAPGDAKLSA